MVFIVIIVGLIGFNIDGFNNEFQIIIKNIYDEIIETYIYKSNDGIPNVNDVKSNLNGLFVNQSF
jgi:hypothetical protein